MLKIQEFILAHENWRELLAAAPYNLKISEEDGYVLFKYNQISSDFNEKICLEARGLILDSTDNFKVVRLAFYKFFNLGEPFAATLDWNSAIAREKLDGSLTSLWYSRGKWHLSSNGTIDGYKANLESSSLYFTSPYNNFGELFEAAAKNCGLDIDKLDKGYIYTFELCSKYNRIVIPYDEPTLYHILTRSAATLEEVEMDIGVPKPQLYNLNSFADYYKLVSEMDNTHEGIVVKDKYGNRVKMKTLSYFDLHRAANNGRMSLERAIDIIRANEQDEFLSYFPEWKDYFEEVKKCLDKIDNIVNTIEFHVNFYKKKLIEEYGNEKDAKREFALIHQNSTTKHQYFDAWNGKLRDKVNNMTTSQLIKYFWNVFGGLNE